MTQPADTAKEMGETLTGVFTCLLDPTLPLPTMPPRVQQSERLKKLGAEARQIAGALPQRSHSEPGADDGARLDSR